MVRSPCHHNTHSVCWLLHLRTRRRLGLPSMPERYLQPQLHLPRAWRGLPPPLELCFPPVCTPLTLVQMILSVHPDIVFQVHEAQGVIQQYSGILQLQPLETLHTSLNCTQYPMPRSKLSLPIRHVLLFCGAARDDRHGDEELLLEHHLQHHIRRDYL